MEQEQITLESLKKELIELKKDVESLKSLKEDLEFARRTEEAYQSIEKGEGIEMEFDDFLKEIKKW
jgi:uncharacterized protein YPO0396